MDPEVLEKKRQLQLAEQRKLRELQASGASTSTPGTATPSPTPASSATGTTGSAPAPAFTPTTTLTAEEQKLLLQHQMSKAAVLAAQFFGNVLASAPLKKTPFVATFNQLADALAYQGFDKVRILQQLMIAYCEWINDPDLCDLGKNFDWAGFNEIILKAIIIFLLRGNNVTGKKDGTLSEEGMKIWEAVSSALQLKTKVVSKNKDNNLSRVVALYPHWTAAVICSNQVELPFYDSGVLPKFLSFSSGASLIPTDTGRALFKAFVRYSVAFDKTIKADGAAETPLKKIAVYAKASWRSNVFKNDERHMILKSLQGMWDTNFPGSGFCRVVFDDKEKLWKIEGLKTKTVKKVKDLATGNDVDDYDDTDDEEEEKEEKKKKSKKETKRPSTPPPKGGKGKST